ncbi:MAG: SH3 domain-containing protein [Planctomycetes bacterium]|nr:SH3 domain-containing protein [Planctomycetota bacterium]
MRVLLVPALALLFAGAPVASAADDVVAPIAAGLEKNANVRFGPSTSAKVVVTLKAGTQVEVFGPAKSSADWYVVRFPKEGKVWVHTKNLKPLDGGVRYQVTQDKTRARNDATMSADVVAELNTGEVVEDKGLVVGDWRAVNIPDAVAYVHKSLISLPADIQKQIDERGQRAAVADQTWQQALSIYAKYVETAKASPKAAVGLDWAGLAKQLDVVIADHASASTRLAAKRVRDSIAALVPVAQQVAPTINVAPPASIDTPAPSPTPAANPAATGTPARGAAAAAAGTKTLSDEELRAITAAMPKPSPWQAEGILVQDDTYMAKVGTRDLLMNGDGDVVAFIKTKDGVDLKLSELQAREVGAKGELLTIPPEQSGLAKPTKLIVATDVAPLR